MIKHISTALLFCGVALSPLTAQACACCSQENTLDESREAFYDLEQAVPLQGNLGVYMYGERGEPEIDVGKSEVSGTLNDKGIKLTLSRNQKTLGTLTLKFKQQPLHKRTGLDFILPDDMLQTLARPEEPPIYHQIDVPVSVQADEALKKALDISFAPEGRVTLHGVGNQCWSPTLGGRWAFQYSVIKQSVTEHGFGKGQIVVSTKP